MTPYKLAASSKSVPSSISSIPMMIDFLVKSLAKCTILPAKVEMSFFTLCGSSMIASNSLKEPMLERFASIRIGSRYFASSVAEMIDFKSIDLPPAFTPVIKSTFLLKSTLTLFGFFSAGWANFSSLITCELFGKTNS